MGGWVDGWIDEKPPRASLPTGAGTLTKAASERPAELRREDWTHCLLSASTPWLSRHCSGSGGGQAKPDAWPRFRPPSSYGNTLPDVLVPSKRGVRWPSTISSPPSKVSLSTPPR